MPFASRLLLSASLALTGCASATPPAPSPPPPPPRAAEAAPAMAPAGVHLEHRAPVDRQAITRACTDLVAKNRALVTDANADRRGMRVVDVGKECHATARGAWAAVVSLASTDDAEDEAVALVHIKGDGTVSAPTRVVSGFDDPVNNHEIDLKVVSDYDGDGDEELWFHRHDTGNEGYDVVQDALFTAKDGDPEPLGSARDIPFVDFKDIDHDGKLDLLVSPFRGESAAPCTGFPSSGEEGPRLAFHARGDGTFSATDAAATSFARVACPVKPAATRTVDDIACARVWGVSRDAIVASMDRIEAECRKGRPPRTGKEACDDLDPCTLFEAERQIARGTPPTTLR